MKKSRLHNSLVNGQPFSVNVLTACHLAIMALNFKKKRLSSESDNKNKVAFTGKKALDHITLYFLWEF